MEILIHCFPPRNEGNSHLAFFDYGCEPVGKPVGEPVGKPVGEPVNFAVFGLFGLSEPSSDVQHHAIQNWNPRLRMDSPFGNKVGAKRFDPSFMKIADDPEVSLNDLRDNQSSSWELAYNRLWKVGWRTAKLKLSFDSAEQIEDLVSQVIGKEIVPQILAPKQEAFVKARTFEDILNLTSRIIANRAIDEIRRRTRRPASSNIEKVSESEFATEADEEKKGTVEEIHLALSGLGDRYRAVIEDFYFADLSTEQIALKQKRPKGSICSDLLKARQMMGKALIGTIYPTNTEGVS